MSNQHGPRFSRETLQGQQHQIHLVRKLHHYQRKCHAQRRQMTLAIIITKTDQGPFHSQDWLADVSILSPFTSRDILRYSRSKPKEKNCPFRLSSHKVQSVWQQLQSTCLSQGSMYLLCICPSLYDYIRSRFHKKQTATIWATKVIPDLPGTIQ